MPTIISMLTRDTFHVELKSKDEVMFRGIKQKGRHFGNDSVDSIFAN